MSVKEWHPGKIGMLWGVSLIVFLVLLSTFASLGRTTALIIWFVLTTPILILTWQWFSGKERQSITAPVAVPQGVVSATTPLTKTRVSALQRLRTPAPRSEKAGYIAIIVVLALHVVGLGWGLAEGVATGHLGAGGRALLVCTVIVACLVTFALIRRPPWGYYVLFAVLWLVWLGYIWVAATNAAGVESSQAGAMLWWATIDMLFVAYLHRRRWWFGIDVPVSVLEKSPEGGWFVLFVVALICTMLAEALVLAATRL
ncbi:MAG TPA: hypothetical protein VEK78_04320 [Gemmatimonadales bacterium]|nr:hypothetical protein [Gemmatimonadales bacterium]